MTATDSRTCPRCRREKPAAAFASRRKRCRSCNALAERRRRRGPAATGPGRSGWEARPPPRPARAVVCTRPPKGALSLGWRVIRFIETFCVFTDGRWIGQPFVLQPWQKAILWALFATGPDGLRVFRWALIGLPKKQGKTELMAALALYFLIADDEPSPLIACAAASEEQADLVFGAAKRMCEMSDKLKDVTDVWDKEITVPGRPGARLVRVAAAAGTNDGKNLSVVIIDELHEWKAGKGESVWNVLTNGLGARHQPMVLQITTAGFDEETICWRQYDYGLKVAQGELRDPAYFFYWQSAPAHLAWDSDAAITVANPNLGVTVLLPFFADQRLKKTQAVFQRYFLNRWTAAEAEWLPAGAWAKCAAPGIRLRPGLPTWVAVDAATKVDSTAVVVGQREGERLRVACRIWERPWDPRSNRPLEEWRLPIDEVKTHLHRLHRRFQPEWIGYDPAWITWAAAELEERGLPMIEIPQTNARMVPGAQGLYTLVLQGQLEHDGNPTLARHIANAVARQVEGGGFRLAKNKARKAMDAAVALAMVVYLAYGEEGPEDATEPHIWTLDEEAEHAAA